MPDKLTDAKAEFLFDQVNRRATLLGILQKTHPRYWYLLPIVRLIMAVPAGLILVLMLAQVVLRETDLSSSIFALAVFLIIGIGINVAILNKRIDALVEVQRQDGMLHSKPAVTELLRDG